MTLSNWIEIAVLVVTGTAVILVKCATRNMVDHFDGAVGLLKKKQCKGLLAPDRQKRR